jgi:hypothetical protein
MVVIQISFSTKFMSLAYPLPGKMTLVHLSQNSYPGLAEKADSA